MKRIIGIERQRGAIRRVQRSALHPAAQPYQDFVDCLLYAMAGICVTEAVGLETRLAEMM